MDLHVFLFTVYVAVLYISEVGNVLPKNTLVFSDQIHNHLSLSELLRRSQLWEGSVVF